MIEPGKAIFCQSREKYFVKNVVHTLLDHQSVDKMIEDGEDGFFETLLDFCDGGSIAVLQAYFDESERRDGLLCVAGYSFTSTHARKFSKDFHALFQPYGGLHMKELVSKKKAYKGISDTKRDGLIKEAVRLVTEHFSYGAAVAVNIHEFNRYAPSQVRGFGHAYPFLCHAVMMAMVTVAKTHNDQNKIHYIFEDGHPRENEARFLVALMTSTPELKEFYRYHGYSFLPKSDAIPLQAADLLAWEVGKFKTETLDTDARPPRLSLMRMIAERGSDRYHLHFLEGAKLQKGMNDYQKLWGGLTEEQLETMRCVNNVNKRPI